MSKFIYFTPEEKAQAQNTDLVSLLSTQGGNGLCAQTRSFAHPTIPASPYGGSK